MVNDRLLNSDRNEFYLIIFLSVYLDDFLINSMLLQEKDLLVEELNLAKHNGDYTINTKSNGITY